jgi:hypothetical protein
MDELKPKLEKVYIIKNIHLTQICIIQKTLTALKIINEELIIIFFNTSLTLIDKSRPNDLYYFIIEHNKIMNEIIGNILQE